MARIELKASIVDFEDRYDLIEVPLGSTYQLACHYCNEQDDMAPKLWFTEKRLIFDDVPQEVKLGMSQNTTDNHLFLDLSNGLVIQNVTADDAGIYFCHATYQDVNNKYNYLLDVVVKPNQTVLGQSEQDLDNFAVSHLTTPNINFSASPLPDFKRLRDTFGILITVLTVWDKWTRCDPCENVRKRSARCLLKPSVYNESVLIALNISDDTTRSVFLASFELSCYSIEIREHLPQVFNMLQRIPDFVLVESCIPYDTLCNPHEAQGPRREPYYRNHYLLPEGSDLFLICPESSTDTAIQWRKDGIIIDPSKSAPGLESKIQLNSFSTLFLIDGSGFDMSGNYTCYVDGVRMQETIVRFISGDVVKEALHRRHRVYLLYILFLSFIFYIGGLIRGYTRRHKFRTIHWDELEQEDEDPRRLEVIVEED
uniref:Ig-like domain-containing protein n=1 Tax=Cacopsylla melanoneura TaxID=428564 RepID=A0A8D9BHY4_9HEMI